MSQDYPLNSEDFYEVYFEKDLIAWKFFGVNHDRLIDCTSRGEKSWSDSKLGSVIREIKDRDLREDGIDEPFAEDYTDEELGAEWRQEYQDCYYSQ